MKNIIIAMALSMFASLANAAYCDTVQNPQRCWQLAIEQAMQTNGNTFQKVTAKLSTAQKKKAERDQVIWWQRVTQGCRNNACVESSLRDRTGWLYGKGEKTFRAMK